jgi:nucleoside-diphosphate-sugar epimerase
VADPAQPQVAGGAAVTGRALVTGGAGFIGSHLAAALWRNGWEVRVLDDLSTGCRTNLAELEGRDRFRLVEGSILDASTVDGQVSEVDVVFHLAAAVGVDLVVTRPLAALTTNVVGSQLVLASAGRWRRKVLLASTSEIYGKSERLPFAEDDDRWLGPPARVRWSYSTSKAVAEYFAIAWHREHGLPVVIARLFNTIGPRQSGRYGMVVPRFVARAVSGDDLEVYGDGRQRRCFCHVSDVVEALVGLAAAEGVDGRAFNVGSDAEVSIHDLARRVLRRSGAPPDACERRIRLVPYERVYGPGFDDMRRRRPDLRRIREAIGWAPRIDLDQTLDELLEAARSAPSR